jgi:hypothetical protein
MVAYPTPEDDAARSRNDGSTLGDVPGLEKLLMDDKALLDWLEAYLEQGCIEMGFEWDGGVYATFRSPGKENVVFRERQDFRGILMEMARKNPL